MSDAAAMETDAKAADVVQELENASAYVAERSMADLLPLPPGWQEITHRSNLPFFYHEPSGCCVWSRPYVLPQPRTVQSVQEHDPPLAAFTREVDGEPWTAEVAIDTTVDILMAVFVDRRRRLLARVRDGIDDGKKRKEENLPSAGVGKTAVSHLQEYCMNVLKTMPKYEVTHQEDPRNPFLTVVLVNGEPMGRGAFANKKVSKRLAAEDALQRLCPALYEQTKQEREEEDTQHAEAAPPAPENPDEVLQWAPDDERLSRLTISVKTPLQLLYEYCNRYHLQPTWTEVPVASVNQTASSFEVKCMLPTHDGRLLTSTIVARTKREGKQRVSQRTLVQLFPHARSWGELIDLCIVRHRDEDKLTSTLAFLDRVKGDLKKSRTEAGTLPAEATSIAALTMPPVKSKAPPPQMYHTGSAAPPYKLDLSPSAIRIAVTYLTQLQSALGNTPELDRRRDLPLRESPPPPMPLRKYDAMPPHHSMPPAVSTSRRGADPHERDWRDRRDRSPIRADSRYAAPPPLPPQMPIYDGMPPTDWHGYRQAIPPDSWPPAPRRSPPPLHVDPPPMQPYPPPRQFRHPY